MGMAITINLFVVIEKCSVYLMLVSRCLDHLSVWKKKIDTAFYKLRHFTWNGRSKNKHIGALAPS